MLSLLLGLTQAAWAQEPAEPPMADESDVEPATAVEPLAEPVAEPAAEVPVAASEGSVARAQFTSAIEEREPVDELSRVENDLQTVYFFSELRDMDGQTVVHRWSYDGNVMADVDFAVGGPRWRVHSSKNLLPEWTGTWVVDVINANGTVVTSRSFEYVAAPPAPAAADGAASEAGMADEAADDAAAPAEASPESGGTE